MIRISPQLFLKADLARTQSLSLLLADTQVVRLVSQFTTDKKCHTLEFNEFLKMMAAEEQKDLRPPEETLVDAFRYPLSSKFSEDGISKGVMVHFKKHILGHLTTTEMAS